MEKYYISYPKVNICFKILGFFDNGYCDIISRYIKVKNSFFDDVIIRDRGKFNILGNFLCKLESNTIFKAKESFKQYLSSDEKLNKKAKYLENFSVEVNKKIPIFSGLGGGSSNAGTYILAMNEILELNLKADILGQIASRVGADVSFFVYDYDSANVSGIGDKISKFEEKIPEIEIITPNISCKTKDVFDTFKMKFNLSEINSNLLESNSIELLKKYKIFELNDLFLPALNLYPLLKEFNNDGYYFSGSGSSFFKLKDSTN